MSKERTSSKSPSLGEFETHLREQVERCKPSERFQQSLHFQITDQGTTLEAEIAIAEIPLMRSLAFWLFRSYELDEDMASDLILAYEEALANVVRHSYQGAAWGWCKTRIARQDDHLTIELHDHGPAGQDPQIAERIASISKEGRPPLRHRGGLGLYLMRRLMDQLSYSTQDGENVLLMGKDLLPNHL
ncbi:MAG: ATP-binding protein [Myxococcales bacterium]|nr:ATP-binding protein [Myxococcales bacterium]